MIQGIAVILFLFFLFALFYIGFPSHKREVVEFEISTKDLPKNKSMQDLKLEIKELLLDMRFNKVSENKYIPPFLIPANEPDLYFYDHTFYLSFKSSKLLKKLILSLLEENF